MRYLSVCSGIEAASCAWKDLSWEAAAFSEIEPFPCAVLQHHYPGTPNWGDMTKWSEWPDDSTDLLVGGTPCQSFSVAGKRSGMDDIRGQLALGFSAIAGRYRPRWIVWENVPGVLSSGRGQDFGAFLGSLAELGYGLCYRVLDAQHFGVAQRRRRVFVVGFLGDWRRAATVLFERKSLCRDTAKSSKVREGIAGTLSSRTTAGGGPGTDFDLTGGLQMAPNPIVLMDQGGSVMNTLTDGTVGTLRREMHGHEPVVAFAQNQMGEVRTGDVFNTLNTNSNASGRNTPMVAQALQVRRLTTIECERLQGFPDNYTSVPYRGKPVAADGPRYKALGNSMAVPVMRWIGERIRLMEQHPPS